MKVAGLSLVLRVLLTDDFIELISRDEVFSSNELVEYLDGSWLLFGVWRGRFPLDPLALFDKVEQF